MKNITLKFQKLSLSAMLLLSIIGCQDVIDITTDPAPQQFVVDAWLNNQLTEQVITLSQSQSYFDTAPLKGVTGAAVIMENSEGDTFEFTEQPGGKYVWMPSEANEIGTIGTTYRLTITANGSTYSATSVMNRVPAIDSIVPEFRDDEIGGPDGIYAEFFARDFEGEGDAYWIKTYKNGMFLNKPREINLAFDSAFDPGSGVDGLIFIPPIREFINRVPDPDTADDSDVAPWAAGDVIRVEIHAITDEAFSFMELARDQMNNGDNTIFAIPLSNTTGNVLNNETNERTLGIFCVSAVSALEKVVE